MRASCSRSFGVSSWLDAVSLPHDVGSGEKPLLGRRIIVYGGGNTAMDAARTVRRLGAEDVMIVYRRDRAHMPAHGFEADEALEEGIRIKWPLSRLALLGLSLRAASWHVPRARARICITLKVALLQDSAFTR